MQGTELFLVADGKCPLETLQSRHCTVLIQRSNSLDQFSDVKRWKNANNDKNAGRTSAQARKESEWI